MDRTVQQNCMKNEERLQLDRIVETLFASHKQLLTCSLDERKCQAV
jgi:hypothetical protein